MSIWRSFLASALLATALSSCAGSGQITNARVCLEIPFLDAPEGACVWTVSREKEIIPAATWAAERKHMLMIDAESWTDIKKDWLRACRIAGPDCNVQVDSVDSVIRSLDKIIGKVAPIVP